MEPQESRAEVEPEVAAAPAEEPTVAPTYSLPDFNYESIDQIDVSAYPADFQEHLTKIVDLAGQRSAEITSARESYESAKDRMMNLVSHMETEDGRDASSLVQHIDQQNSAIDLLLSEVTSTSFAAFTKMHPELRSLPKNVQAEVESQFSGIGSRYNTGSVLDQMEEAYSYALYRSKWTPDSAEKTPQTVTKPQIVQQKQHTVVEKFSTPANVDARKQSVVADGSVATTTPRRDVNEMSWDELLDRNLHLI